MKKLPCPVCSETLSVRLATGRKSGKPFVMLVCPIDGRHIRAFVSDGTLYPASSRRRVYANQCLSRSQRVGRGRRGRDSRGGSI